MTSLEEGGLLVEVDAKWQQQLGELDVHGVSGGDGLLVSTLIELVVRSSGPCASLFSRK